MTDGASLGNRGLWIGAWQRLRKNRAAIGACIVLAVIALAALAGPALSPHAYDRLDWAHLAEPPRLGGAHWLGTDRLGRDLLVRTLYGARVSLVIGLLAALVSIVIGVTWGAVAGYAGRRVGELMMRLVDVLYSLPYLFIVIILTMLFGRGKLLVLCLAIGAVGWLTMARIVRAQALALKHREFVEAARAIGVSAPAIVIRHIIPNLLGPVTVYATLTIPQMILYESFLSFLGLGVQEPRASLGSLLNVGGAEMEAAVWMLLVPACVLVTLLLCLNLLGDGLRDALDPSDTRD